MTYIYDKQGKPISIEEFSRLLGDMEYKRVAVDVTPAGNRVSTVWLGVDHDFLSRGYPIIFETMVFSNGNWSDEMMERYATEEQAREGHARMLNAVLAMEAVGQDQEVPHGEAD